MVEKSLVALIHEARSALRLHTNVDLAKFLGVSRRTVQRHHHRGGLPTGGEVAKLVRVLYPVNPQLAKTIGNAFRVDLSDLEPPPKPATAPPPPRAPTTPPAAREHVAMVIVAACDALNLPPREVRPALSTIFSQVRSLGVDLDQLTKLLAGGEAREAKKRL